jgi:hypothetical protein
MGQIVVPDLGLLKNGFSWNMSLKLEIGYKIPWTRLPGMLGFANDPHNPNNSGG